MDRSEYFTGTSSLLLPRAVDEQIDDYFSPLSASPLDFTVVNRKRLSRRKRVAPLLRVFHAMHFRPGPRVCVCPRKVFLQKKKNAPIRHLRRVSPFRGLLGVINSRSRAKITPANRAVWIPEAKSIIFACGAAPPEEKTAEGGGGGKKTNKIDTAARDTYVMCYRRALETEIPRKCLPRKCSSVRARATQQPDGRNFDPRG